GKSDGDAGSPAGRAADCRVDFGGEWSPRARPAPSRRMTMFRRWLPALAAGVLGVGLWAGSAAPARAENLNISKFYYYPYYYFPHNYWPAMGPQWPEPPGAPCLPPPAYMAFPPYREPHWRYEYWKPQFYHRGYHFMLDIF